MEKRTTGLTCPECRGPLSEERQGRIVEYACGVGHRYTPLAMEDEEAARYAYPSSEHNPCRKAAENENKQPPSKQCSTDPPPNKWTDSCWAVCRRSSGLRCDLRAGGSRLAP